MGCKIERNFKLAKLKFELGIKALKLRLNCITFARRDG